jgi:hypothetical protein
MEKPGALTSSVQLRVPPNSIPLMRRTGQRPRFYCLFPKQIGFFSAG